MTALDRREPRVIWGDKTRRVVYTPGHERGAYQCERCDRDALGGPSWVRVDDPHERASILGDALLHTQEKR